MDVVQGSERFTTLSLFMYTYVFKHVKYVKIHRVESKHPPISTRLVMWDAAPIARFAVPLRLLVPAKADTAAVLARAPLPLVLAEAAPTTVMTLAPLPLVLTEAAADAVLARAPPQLVLAEAAPTAVMTLALMPLVLTEAADSAVLARVPLQLVLADAASTAVLTPAPLPLVLTEDRGLAGLLGCRRIWRWRCGWSQAQCVGWVHITPVVLAALALWPAGCVPLAQHSLLALRCSLQTINVIRHPVLRRVLGGCAINHVQLLFSLASTGLNLLHGT